MAFAEVFSDIRKRRRLKTREFEIVGIPSSYVVAIEKELMLPGREKLDTLKSHVGHVAIEQDSLDGPFEQTQLELAWLQDHLGRLGIDVDTAFRLAKLSLLDPEQQDPIFDAIDTAEINRS